MCVQNFCEHCGTYLGNLELCYLMEQMSATGDGLVCPNLELTKRDPRVEMCYVCTMSQDAGCVGFDTQSLFASAVSERDAASDQIPDMSKQQRTPWAYPSTLSNDDREPSYRSAGQPRRLLPSQSGITVQPQAPRPSTTPRNVSQQPVQIRSDSKIVTQMSHLVPPGYICPVPPTEGQSSPYYSSTDGASRRGRFPTGLEASANHLLKINSRKNETHHFDLREQGVKRDVAISPRQQLQQEHRGFNHADNISDLTYQPHGNKLQHRSTFPPQTNTAVRPHDFSRSSTAGQSGFASNPMSPTINYTRYYGGSFESGSHDPPIFGDYPSSSEYPSSSGFDAPRTHEFQSFFALPSMQSPFSAIHSPLLSPFDAPLMSFGDRTYADVASEQSLKGMGGQHSDVEGRIQHQSSQREPFTRRPITKPTKERKRAGKACSNCRERKVKCDEGTPTCGPCLAKERTGCDYSWEPKYGRLGKPKRIPEPKRSTRNTGPEPQPEIRPMAARPVMPRVEADSVVDFCADEVDFHGASEPEDWEAEVALALAKEF